MVATVTQASDLDFLRSAESVSTDVLEFRLDNLFDRKEEALEAMSQSALPTLSTVRAEWEGGSGNFSAAEREAIYREALSNSSFIDIEVSSQKEGIFDELLSEAGSRGIQRVGSYHDFTRFPGIDALRRVIDEAFSRENDIVKVAVFIENRSDLFALAELVADTRSLGRPISAMGMGPLGKLSRLVLPEAGSCLNYGFLQVANAPGQWPASELRSLLNKLQE